MSITWKELQETCLRKMDSLDGVALTKDSNNAAYLYGMPDAFGNEREILEEAADNYAERRGDRHRGRAFGRFSCLRPAAAGGWLLLH